MKYIVIANRWDDNRKQIVECSVGCFETFVNAKLFKEAYEEHYKLKAKILDVEQVTAIFN